MDHFNRYLKLLFLIIFSSLLSSCDSTTSYKSCEKYHWKIIYDCKAEAGVMDDPRGLAYTLLYGPGLNDRFYRCVANSTLDDKKYNQCIKAGHLVRGISGFLPSGGSSSTSDYGNNSSENSSNIFSFLLLAFGFIFLLRKYKIESHLKELKNQIRENSTFKNTESIIQKYSIKIKSNLPIIVGVVALVVIVNLIYQLINYSKKDVAEPQLKNKDSSKSTVKVPIKIDPPSTSIEVPQRVRTSASVIASSCERPEYPSISKKLEEEGTVYIKFLVDAEGKVIQSEIERSSGYKRLDEAALNGLSLCKFKPATEDGRPEQAWTSMKFTWRLE